MNLTELLLFGENERREIKSFLSDFTEETKRNGYMITYGQSGTWVYQKDSVMS